MTGIYFDYSATTRPSARALEAFTSACACFGNPNSVHGMGLEAGKLIEDAGSDIISLLGVSEMDIIYTSGATEANNLAIKGCFERFSSGGRTHIITTEFEHSSVTAPVGALIGRGASVDFVPVNADGHVDISALRSLIRDDTLLVSVGCVSSELGIRQPIEDIGRVIRTEFPGVLFHSDITQAVGKCRFDLRDVDLASFSGHKFCAFKGIGALLKKKSLIISPQNQGGNSTTRFRSGTPATELIVSMAAALEDTLDRFDGKLVYVNNLNRTLREEMSRYDGVVINSPSDAVPQILNLSVLGIDAEKTQKWFDGHGIYFSTRSACSKGARYSAAVKNLTGSEERAASSIRISLSYNTTQEEIRRLSELFGEFCNMRK